MTRQKDRFLFLAVAAVLLLTLLFPQPVQSARPLKQLAQEVSNDAFANAAQINLNDTLTGSTYGAGLEMGEPIPDCNYTPYTSVWYAYTSAVSDTVTASISEAYYHCVRVYTGSDLTSLFPAGLTSSYDSHDSQSFVAQAGTTYYIQVGTFVWSQQSFKISLAPAPDPYLGFSVFVRDGGNYSLLAPSSYDQIILAGYGYDPAGVEIQHRIWDLWDGRRLVNETEIHFSNLPDGDYPITFTITTIDGRSASYSQTMNVRTHDIVLSRFSLPDVGRPGLTRTVTAYIQNTHYPETAIVEFYVSMPGYYDTWRLVDTKTVSVPARAPRQFTKVSFDYTFTQEDANLGTVNFKGVATIVDENGNQVRDALSADNTAISLPVRVRK